METAPALDVEEDIALAEAAPIHERSDYERERGKPMPSQNHSYVQANLIGCLLQFRRFFRVHSELSLHLPTLRATPDICLFPYQEIDYRHDQITVSEPPILAIEILSPSQTLDMMMEEFDRYFENGVKSCWLVQPQLETVTVVHPNQKPRTYDAGVMEDAVVGIAIPMEEVFA
jgi:Uma2 family endonuclease